jgi:hypothetical protein
MSVISNFVFEQLQITYDAHKKLITKENITISRKCSRFTDTSIGWNATQASTEEELSARRGKQISEACYDFFANCSQAERYFFVEAVQTARPHQDQHELDKKTGDYIRAHSYEVNCLYRVQVMLRENFNVYQIRKFTQVERRGN